VNHPALNPRVINYEAERRKCRLRLLGEWMKPISKTKLDGVILYQAVDKFGDSIDFLLSSRRVKTLFKQTMNANKFPSKGVMDKSSAIYAGWENINILLMLAGLISFPDHLLNGVPGGRAVAKYRNITA
jgi:putative transposase